MLEDLYLKITDSAKNHNFGYHHYTNMRSYINMSKTEHFFLSRLDKMNDKLEQFKIDSARKNRTYILSLSYGRNENIAMWALYCIPKEEAVRITFTKNSFNNYLGDAGDIAFKVENFQVKKDVQYRIESLTSIDVLYKSEKDNALKHGGEYITADGNDLNGRFLGAVKNMAWSYENEVRIIIILASDTDEYPEKIAIPITNELIKDMKLKFGPWTTIKAKENLISELKKLRDYWNIGNPSVSFINGTVAYKSLCDYCKGPYIPKTSEIVKL